MHDLDKLIMDNESAARIEYCAGLYDDVNKVLLNHGMTITDLQFVVDAMRVGTYE